VRRLHLYHLQLAAKGLRRDYGLSVAITVGMMLATSIFAISVLHTLRLHGPKPSLGFDLHQVEVKHADAFTALPEGSAWTGELAVRTRVTAREHEVLIASGLRTRQTSTFRARLQVAGPAEAPAVSLVRFVTADFFAMFARPFAWGGPWTAADEAAPVVVLSMPLGRRLFGDRDPRGHTIRIDGRPHRIVGMLADHQPIWPEWDVSAFGLDQDALYLPFGEARPLLARPERPVFQAPVGPGYDDLLRSNTIYISHWIELPTAAERAAYQRHLDQRFGPGAYQLRDLRAWRQSATLPETGAKFFLTLSLILLLGGGFNMMRLLLARDLSREEDTGIYRALGAPRSAIFSRHMLEAAMLLLPAGVLGTILACPYIWLWNRIVRDTDIPLTMTALGFVVSAGTAIVIGLLSAIYPAVRMANVKPARSVMRR
jgi:putative ABC transport system permease protein